MLSPCPHNDTKYRGVMAEQRSVDWHKSNGGDPKRQTEDIMRHFCNAVEAECQTGVPSDEEGRKTLFVSVIKEVNKSMRRTNGLDLETRFSELRACSRAWGKFIHSFDDFTQTSFKKALATVHAKNLEKKSGATAKRQRKKRLGVGKEKRLGAGKRHVGEPRVPTRAGQRGAKKRPTREPEPEPEQ